MLFSVRPVTQHSGCIYTLHVMAKYIFLFDPRQISDVLSRGSAVRRSYPETKQNTCAAVQQQQAFPSICPISLTFIGGDAHVDSCILMSTAFGWRVSSRVASWGEGPQSGVNSELFSGSADAALSGQDNTFSVVCPLSYSMCVKPKTTVSWRTQGNGYRCNVAEDFPPLCIGVYHSCAVMCPLSRL